MPVIALPAFPRSWTSPVPHGVGVVEPDQPSAVRCVQGQRIVKSVRPFRSHHGSQHDELYPVPDIVHEQGLAVKWTYPVSVDS